VKLVFLDEHGKEVERAEGEAKSSELQFDVRSRSDRITKDVFIMEP